MTHNYKSTSVLMISLCYLTFSLACDPIAFRMVDIFGFAIVGSGITYSALYTMLDMLTYLCGRRYVYFLILAFHFFDLLFSYIIYGISLLPYPVGFQQYKEVDLVFSHFPRLFWGGIVGAIAAGIVEVSLYSYLQNKIKNFFKASGISIMIVILGHNLISDYISFKDILNDNYSKVMVVTFISNCITLIIYSFIGYFALKLIDKKTAQYKNQEF